MVPRVGYVIYRTCPGEDRHGGDQLQGLRPVLSWKVDQRRHDARGPVRVLGHPHRRVQPLGHVPQFRIPALRELRELPGLRDLLRRDPVAPQQVGPLGPKVPNLALRERAVDQPERVGAKLLMQSNRRLLC